MPSTKEHIQVRFPADEMAVLRRLAKLQRVSMASVLNDLFTAAMPTYERVVVFAESAQRLSGDARRDAAGKVKEAADVVLPKLGEAMRQADIFLGQIEQSVNTTQGRRPGASAATHGRRPSRSGKARPVKRAKAK
jgi:hypothetical protein